MYTGPKRFFCVIIFFTICAFRADCVYNADTLSAVSIIDGGDIVLYDLYSQNKDNDEGPVYARMFLERADTASTDIRIAEVWDYMGRWYESQTKTNDAIDALEKARKIYRFNSDIHMAAIEELKLAGLYLKNDMYHKTLDYVLKAQEVLIKEKDIPHILDCYNILGIVYYVCMEYDQAKQYFDIFASGARNISDTSRMISAMNNAARLANTVHDTVMTNKLIQEATTLCAEQGDSVKLGKLYLNFFEAYIDNGDVDKAERYLHLAKPLIKTDGDKGEYYMKLGYITSLVGKRQKAIACLNKALDYLKAGEFKNEKQYCFNLLHRLYAAENDWEDAYKALNGYYMIDDSRENNEIILELFRYQSDLEASKTEEKLKESRNRMTIIFISGVGILLIGGIYLIMNVKKRKLKVEHFKSELANQEKMLEMKKLQQYYIDKMAEDTVDKLIRLKADIKDVSVKNKVNQICRNLVQSKVDDDKWKEVSQFIPEYNSEFYHNLIREFPDLTINERRLCTLLNKNMTTKEISEITKQSLQSINTARGRLRAKLGLTDSKITLQEFLSRYN